MNLKNKKMKKFITNIMMATVLFISCTKENFSVTDQIVTINATITSDTKVALGENDEKKVNWTEGDIINLIINEASYPFTWKEGTTFEYTGNAQLPTLTPDLQITATYVSAFNAIQSGLKADLGNYMALYAEQTVTTEQNYGDLNLIFSHGTSILKLTLSNDAFKGNDITDVTLKAGGMVVATATETFTGCAENGSVTAYFAIQQGSMKNVTIQAACGANTYFATISDKELVSGTLYNADVELNKDCFLPKGSTFCSQVTSFLNSNSGLTKIMFIANVDCTPEAIQIDRCGAYMVANTTTNTLEIRTPASCFVFNADCNAMFSGNRSKIVNIESIDFGGCINTENVKNMSDMFYSCQTLKSLDLSSFNTANVTSMSSMFAVCRALQNLNLSSFNTANVTSMEHMFNQCNALQSLDLSSFNTANVTSMNSMFFICQALQSLDLSSFNTSNVTLMGGMFEGCEALQSLDLSSFNTANVTDMSYMFSGCEALQSLDLNSFNTAKVTSMSSMFSGCEALQSLDLSSFNTANVTYMSYMFYECKALQSLDLNSFNTAKVTSMSSMFEALNSSNTGEITLNLTGFIFPKYISFIFSNAKNVKVLVTQAGYDALKNNIPTTVKCYKDENTPWE